VREEKLTSIACIAVSFTLLAIFPESLFCGLALVSSIGLYAMLEYIRNKKVDELDDLRAQIKLLNDKMEGITITRGLR